MSKSEKPKRRECPECRRSIAVHEYGTLRRHKHGSGWCIGSGNLPTSRTVRQAVQSDVPWISDMSALRAALVRMLWCSIADDVECTCWILDDGSYDTCPECQAMKALGLGRWLGANDAEKRLPSSRNDGVACQLV